MEAFNNELETYYRQVLPSLSKNCAVIRKVQYLMPRNSLLPLIVNVLLDHKTELDVEPSITF